jgi:hypothetical protein
VGNTQVKEMGLYGREFSPTVAIPVNPPWLLPPPVVDLEVLERLQKDMMFKRHLDTVYQDFVAIYTYGSKDPRTGRTGSALKCRNVRWQSGNVLQIICLYIRRS